MNKLNAKQLLDMIESGCNNLTNYHQEIDSLNVFPVPDGDTGTNMNLTFTSGFAEIKGSEFKTTSELAKVFSRGLLMGARGNSGVILSQIFRGFSQGIADLDEIDAKQLAQAFDQGKTVAYRAVMRPVEGTILTVLRMSAEKTVQYVNDAEGDLSILDVMTFMVDAANEALQITPTLLPVLKEVGVVDSGGAGYLKILEGFLSYLKGTPITTDKSNQVSNVNAQSQFEHEEFGYCTEFIIQLNEKSIVYFNEATFRNELEQLGNSLVVVQDEDIVKVHVHTLTPGDALNLGQRYGEFVKLKIENMSTQHAALIDHNVESLEKTLKVETASPIRHEEKTFALVSVCAGEGIENYFKQLRVDSIISGGQTMNPSTEDFVSAIEKLNAKHIFVLPNNSNILLAAKQAQQIVGEEKISVIDSVSIPEGLSACIAFNPELSVEENLNNMKAAISNTRSGQVTYAIKDTTFNGLDIKAGDYMSISGKQIVSVHTNKVDALSTLIKEMVHDDCELVSIILGEDSHEDEISHVIDQIENEYDITVEVIDGGQPVYSYIIGVE